MSADNWAICPKCNQKQLKEQIDLAIKVQANYGILPVEDWLELKSQLDNPMKLDFTLREDYHIGVDGQTGKFFVTYKAGCRVCGFVYEYKHVESVT